MTSSLKFDTLESLKEVEDILFKDQFLWEHPICKDANDFTYTHLRDICTKNIDNTKIESVESVEPEIRRVSLLILGHIFYNYEDDYSFNKRKASKYYKQCAEEFNDTHAMFYLGSYYEDYHRDRFYAIYWYINAIEKGSCIYSMYDLGLLYLDSNEKEKGIKLLIKSAESGHIEAMLRITKIQENPVDFMPWIIRAYKETHNIEHLRDRVNEIIDDLIKHRFEEDSGNLIINLIIIFKELKNAEIPLTEEQQDIYNSITETCVLNNIYSDVNTDQCPVCTESLKGTTSPIIVLVCGHVLHHGCIKDLDKCPCCRKLFKI